jgi:hypothetical protein
MGSGIIPHTHININMNIKYFIIHSIVMSYFSLPMQWHLAGGFDRQLQNIAIQKWRFPLRRGDFQVTDDAQIAVDCDVAGQIGVSLEGLH